ncbi:glycosyltransferase family 2 protein [Candidatus Poribacteria bacterium]
MKDDIEYSIVVPVYNSTDILDELHDRVKSVFRDITENYEIILVDDCSRDDSWEKMQILREKDERVKIIHLSRNSGQHNATLCGFGHCSGNYIITLDDDLQNPPEEIPKLIEKILEGYMIVMGKYKRKRHSIFRNLLTKTFHRLVHAILEIPRDIYMSSFAIYRDKVIKYVVSIRSSYVFLPAFTFRSVSADEVATVEVNHDERKIGKSNYNLLKMFKLSLNLIINFSSLPLTLIGIFGFITSVMSIGYGTMVFIKKVLDPDYGVTGWNSLIVAVTFLGGAILMSVGVIGEYLRRILTEISGREQYIIGDKRGFD